MQRIRYFPSFEQYLGYSSSEQIANIESMEAGIFGNCSSYYPQSNIQSQLVSLEHQKITRSKPFFQRVLL
jgi:hypothetical protein